MWANPVNCLVFSNPSGLSRCVFVLSISLLMNIFVVFALLSTVTLSNKLFQIFVHISLNKVYNVFSTERELDHSPLNQNQKT